MYTSGGAERPSSVLVDAMLWQYMQKAGGQWATELADVRDRMGVLMSESATDDGQVALTLAGVDDDVAEATDRVRSLLDRGRAAVSTVDVVCPDAAVRAKLMRFSDHLNKSPAYVCVQADGRMTVTGTTAELDECRVKLTKLGASLSSRDQGATTETAGGGHDDEPVPNSPWSDLGSGRAGPPQDLAEDERIARQLQQQEHAQHTQFLRPGGGGGGGGVAGQDGRHHGEIPVPIEHELWSFVEKRRGHQLQQLRDAYRVQISTSPAAQDGGVMIALDAESALMLECAQDELVQLLETLRGSVVVVQLGDEGADRGRQMPPQIGQLFSQLADGTDAVIDVKDNVITITGPEVTLASFSCHILFCTRSSTIVIAARRGTIRYDTIREAVLTCAIKLTYQVNLPHGTKN